MATDIEMIDADDFDIDINVDLMDDPVEDQVFSPPTQHSAGNALTETHGNTAVSPAAQPTFHAVPNAINLQGVDEFTPEDPSAYVEEHFISAYLIETAWVNDSSVNLIFATEESAMNALSALTASEIFNANELPTEEQRPAKAYSKTPVAKLYVRQMNTNDAKKKGARLLSKFYLMNPRYDPENIRSREQPAQDRGRPDRRRGSHDHKKYGPPFKGREPEAASHFHEDMYDDDYKEGAKASPRNKTQSPAMMDSYRPSSQVRDAYPPASQTGSASSRSGDFYRPNSRGRDGHRGHGRGRGKELIRGNRDHGRLTDRDRSASPIRRGRHDSNNRRHRSPSFGDRARSNTRNKPQELFGGPSRQQDRLYRQESPREFYNGSNRNGGRLANPSRGGYNNGRNSHNNVHRNSDRHGARELIDTDDRLDNRYDGPSAAPVWDKSAFLGVDPSKEITRDGGSGNTDKHEAPKELFSDPHRSGPPRELFGDAAFAQSAKKKPFPNKTDHSNHRRTDATDETAKKRGISNPVGSKGSLFDRITPRGGDDNGINIKGQASQDPGINVRGAAQPELKIKGKGRGRNRPQAHDFDD
jgi:hypothetical protein